MRILIVPVVAVALSLAPEARAEPSNSHSARLLSVDPITPTVSLLAGQTEAPPTPPAEVVPKHALSITPLLLLGPIIGLYPIAIEYEMALNDSLSVYATPGFVFISSGLVSGWTIGLNVGARYYLMSGPAIRGLWVGGDVGLSFASTTSVTGLGFQLNALVGYNFLLGAFEFSPGIGLTVNPANSTPVGLALRLNVGYAF